MSAEQDEPTGPEEGAPAGDEQLDQEQLRAQLERELERIKVSDVLLQTLVSLVNLGFQRLGLATEDEQAAERQHDPDQARLAIEAVRALLPVAEGADPEQVRPVRDALSQLQLAYVRVTEGKGGAPEPEPESDGEQDQPDPDQPEPKSSGKLWTPPGA